MKVTVSFVSEQVSEVHEEVEDSLVDRMRLQLTEATGQDSVDQEGTFDCHGGIDSSGVLSTNLKVMLGEGPKKLTLVILSATSSPSVVMERTQSPILARWAKLEPPRSSLSPSEEFMALENTRVISISLSLTS